MASNIDNILNTAGVFCYTTRDQYILQRRVDKSIQKELKLLVINRQNFAISETKMPGTEIKSKSKRAFSAFIGILTIYDFKFLVFVDQVKIVSTIPGIQLFEIKSLFFQSYMNEKLLEKSPNKHNIFRSLRQINILLTKGFYFSYNYKADNSLQYQDLQSENQFTWNYRLLQQLEKYNVDKIWMRRIIQGFVGSFETIIQGCKVQYLLISRRSVKKSGTRYFDRGINEHGDTANFVQTEQIIVIGDYKISDIQIRGNVPLFFEQKGLTTQIKLVRGFQLTHKAYEKHFSHLKKNYFRIFIVNLLSKHKTGQKLLIGQFQRHLKNFQDPDLRYFYFDFHEKVQGTNFDRVDEGVFQVAEMKKNLKFYLTQKGSILQRQSGVFRTNCLDCLDRTNFFQAKLALLTLQEILKLFGITFHRPLIQIMNDPFDEIPIIKLFRNIWAENGDKLSQHYTGTGSTHTDITRDGKRGWMGTFTHKYKSVTRFYNQNFDDFYKMKRIDLFLGKSTIHSNDKSLPQLIIQRQQDYVRSSFCQIYLFSWKVPKKIPSKLIQFPTNTDIIAISLQQIDQDQEWKKLVRQSIDHEKYILVTDKVSNHNYLAIYSHISLYKRVSKVQICKVKFKSFLNHYFSTKCAIVARFRIDNTSFVFAGCQLQYGRDGFENRLSNLKEIHEYAFQEEVVGQKTSKDILEDDVVFLFGNMNTCISSNFMGQFKKLQKLQPNLNGQQKKLIRQMLQTDEFQSLRQCLIQFRYYQQEQLKFQPTYKFNYGYYDPQKSGWPDRIWFSTEKKIICSQYKAFEGIQGEHLPVYGIFQVQCQQIDDKARQTVIHDITTSIIELEKQSNSSEQQLDSQPDKNFKQIEIIRNISSQNVGQK